MKSFLKQVTATVVGILLFFIIIGVFSVMSIVGMIASEEATKTVAKNSVLVIDLKGMIAERSEDNIFGQFLGNEVATTGLDDIVSAIKKAKDNDNVKGIYIEAGVVDANGYASLQEIRNALVDFRKAGKWIVAYADNYTQGAYYVASVADKVLVNPKGMVDWHGIASQPMFYKDVLAKFGVRYEVVKVGTFKSATEVYTEEKMSDANRAQVTQFVNGIWSHICKDVSESRKVSIDSLNAYADRLITFESAENLKRYKLVDDLVYADAVKDVVKQMLKIDKDKQITKLSVSDMRNVRGVKSEGEEIAVYYAYGTIVQSEAVSMLNSGHSIVGSEMCKDLEDLMNDDDVKAVVLRVNSGGGDAYASEQIWHQVMKLKEKKPVVVSMGDYAASGAYYLSCPADWIVAQSNTLTGSIGIFAAMPEASELITKKLGVKFDEVKTNRNSAFGNLMARPFNDEERYYLQNYVNRGYELFRKRVADGRKQKTEDIEKIAQGRVWLATDAKQIKLVDEIGGLDQAVAKAAALAKLKEYHTATYPAPTDWTDQFMAATNGGNYLDETMRQTLGDLYEPVSLFMNLNHREALQARIPYVLNIK